MNSNIEQIELNDIMCQSYMSYAMSTIVDRALPDVRDGCLPIHRRILYAMKNRGLTADKPFAKSSEPVSETMKIHSHGDSSIYGSLALLTDRNETLLYPFLEGDGSFGKVYSTDSPSHMRYTFCRLNDFSQEMFHGLNKNAVKMIGEDGHFQPVVLPTSYPNILVKPNNAIAVGEACNFGSFPLAEVCDITSAYIDSKDIVVSDYLTPDFSTGAELIYNKAQLENIYTTGKGKVILRSKYRYFKEEGIIEIYEIPYSTTAQKIISEIIDKMPKLKDITDVRDETGYNKETEVEELKIAIDVKKNVNIDVLMARLFQETSLQTSFSFNMNCLVNNRPQVLGIKQILNEWILFRVEVIKNIINFDLAKKKQSLHLLLGLEQILLDIDKTIDIIRNSEEDIVIGKLMEYFNIDEEQAEYVSNIKLRNINKDFILKQINGINLLKEEVKTIQSNVNDDTYIHNQIKEELANIKKKYGKDRKTSIVHEDTVVKIASSKFIEDYTTTNVLTKEMYYKKCRRYADAEKHRVKDGDAVVTITQCSNTGKVIFITNLGNAYMVNLDDIEEKTASAMGIYLPSILSLETDETVIGMITTSDYKGYALIMYENAKLAKIPLTSFKTKTNRTKLSNSLSLLNGAVIMISQSNTDIELELTDCFGNIRIVDTKNINSKKARDTIGVTTWCSKRSGFKIANCKINIKDKEIIQNEEAM